MMSLKDPKEKKKISDLKILGGLKINL